MQKFATLINSINNFSNYSHHSYRMLKLAQAANDLISQSEEYDIKDETLFNQFETFMNAYKDLITLLGDKELTPNDFDEDARMEARQLIDTLKIRFDRIMSNPYLDMDVEQGFDEDFNPGSFTKFVMEVMQNADNKLKAIATEFINIYDQEFKNIDEDYKGNKEDIYSAIAKNKANEATKEWYQKTMALKNTNHPRYVALIESRKRAYQNIMSDPNRKEDYMQKARLNQKKYQEKIKEEYSAKRKQLKLLIPKARKEGNINLLKQLEDQLVDVEKHLVYVYRKNIGEKIKEVKQTNTLDGLITKLNQNIANVKMGIKKDITADLKSNEAQFKAIEDKINASYAEQNQFTFAAAKQELQKTMNEYAENNPKLIEYKENSKQYYEYISKLKLVNKQGWMNNNVPLEDVRPHLETIKDEGKQLIEMAIPKFKSPNNTIQAIVDLFNYRLNGSGRETTAMNRTERLQTIIKIMAEDQATDDINLADDGTIGGKIFNELLQNLFIEELDN